MGAPSTTPPRPGMPSSGAASWSEIWSATGAPTRSWPLLAGLCSASGNTNSTKTSTAWLRRSGRQSEREAETTECAGGSPSRRVTSTPGEPGRSLSGRVPDRPGQAGVTPSQGSSCFGCPPTSRHTRLPGTIPMPGGTSSSARSRNLSTAAHTQPTIQSLHDLLDRLRPRTGGRGAASASDQNATWHWTLSSPTVWWGWRPSWQRMREARHGAKESRRRRRGRLGSPVGDVRVPSPSAPNAAGEGRLGRISR